MEIYRAGSTVKRKAQMRWAVLVAMIAGAATPVLADDKETCKKTLGDEGIAICSRAIASDRYRGADLADLYSSRGIKWVEKGEHKRAIEDYTQSIRIKPEAMVFKFRAETYRETGDIDRAIADYSEAISLEKEDPDYYYLRGNAHRSKGDFDRAIADYEMAIKLDPEDADPFNARGNAYAAAGQLDNAIADYTKAIALDKDLAIAYFNRAEAYAQKGDSGRALADYGAALRLDPKDLRALHRRGATYLKQRDFARAIADYAELIRLDDKLAAGYYGRGLAHSLAGQRDRAIADLGEAIRHDPSHVLAFQVRGLVYSSNGDYERAISDFSDAIRLDPNNAERYLLRAWASFKAGRPQLALIDADRALAIDPELLSAYATRGQVYAALGRNDEAAAENKTAEGIRAKRQEAERLRLVALDQERKQALAEMVRPGRVFRDCPECPEMVVVPAGEFMMGSLPSEKNRSAPEGPVHKVIIQQPFAVGKFEITRREYEIFIKESGHSVAGKCTTVEHGGSFHNLGFKQTPAHPVVCVNWSDAKAYVAWLSSKTGSSYRLLSEAEFEYALRSGSQTRYHFGNDEKRLCEFANAFDRTASQKYSRTGYAPAKCKDGHVYTAPVGQYAPNSFGLHDMIGNVSEWVEDCWHDSYNGAPIDGSAWTLGGDCNRRMHRGGAWVFIPDFFRSASRIGYSSGRYDYIGFRVAKTLDP